MSVAEHAHGDVATRRADAAVATDALLLLAAGLCPLRLMTAERCHGAARDERLVLKTQESHARPGAAKLHETGFVNVFLLKRRDAAQAARYYGKVRTVYLGYYRLPEQAALTVARYHRRVEAAMVQVLVARLGPVQASAARALGAEETKRAGVELMQVWCYQRGLNMFNITALELRASLRALTKAATKKKVRDGTAATGECKVPAELDAALALRTTLAGVDDARREEGRTAQSNSPRFGAAVDLAIATDDEAG